MCVFGVGGGIEV